MLSASSAALLALGIVVVLVLPGPTNRLLAAAGLRQGFKRSARLTAAKLVGYLVSISLWGHFLAQTAHSLTWLPTLIRIASSLYTGYLAIRMWRTTVTLPSSTRQATGLRTLFVATLLNPKAILFAGTIFPTGAFVSLPTYMESMFIFASLLVPIGFAWIVFGAELGSERRMWLSPVHVQRCASIMPGTFSLPLLIARVGGISLEGVCLGRSNGDRSRRNAAH
jgi:threonine/homoserine/homoserine lactone efflux protein